MTNLKYSNKQTYPFFVRNRLLSFLISYYKLSETLAIETLRVNRLFAKHWQIFGRTIGLASQKCPIEFAHRSKICRQRQILGRIHRQCKSRCSFRPVSQCLLSCSVLSCPVLSLSVVHETSLCRSTEGLDGPWHDVVYCQYFYWCSKCHRLQQITDHSKQFWQSKMFKVSLLIKPVLNPP